MWRHPVIEFWELGYVDQNFLNENFDVPNRIATSWTNSTCLHARLSHACARCWWKSSSNTEHVNNHMFRSGKFASSVPRLFLTSISNPDDLQSKKDDLWRVWSFVVAFLLGSCWTRLQSFAKARIRLVSNWVMDWNETSELWSLEESSCLGFWPHVCLILNFKMARSLT